MHIQSSFRKSIIIFIFSFLFLGTPRNTGFTQDDLVLVHMHQEARRPNWWSSVASGFRPNMPPQLQPTVQLPLSITTHLRIQHRTSVLHHLCHKIFTQQQHHHLHQRYRPYHRLITSCTSTTKSTSTKPRHRATVHQNLTSGELEIGQRA